MKENLLQKEAEIKRVEEKVTVFSQENEQLQERLVEAERRNSELDEVLKKRDKHVLEYFSMFLPDKKIP